MFSIKKFRGLVSIFSFDLKYCCECLHVIKFLRDTVDKKSSILYYFIARFMIIIKIRHIFLSSLNVNDATKPLPALENINIVY